MTAKQRQLLHRSSYRAVVPLREPDKRYVLVRKWDVPSGFPVIRRKPEVRYVQPCLQPLLPHEPVAWTLILGIGPFVESGCHQGLITAEIHQGSDPERRDQLTSSDRS